MATKFVGESSIISPLLSVVSFEVVFDDLIVELAGLIFSNGEDVFEEQMFSEIVEVYLCFRFFGVGEFPEDEVDMFSEFSAAGTVPSNFPDNFSPDVSTVCLRGEKLYLEGSENLLFTTLPPPLTDRIRFRR